MFREALIFPKEKFSPSLLLTVPVTYKIAICFSKGTIFTYAEILILLMKRGGCNWQEFNY